MSTIPMMAMTQGKPIASAMEPPMDGPEAAENKFHLGQQLAAIILIRDRDS